MTKWFYDTEFHEDGNTIDFISIGMVSEHGKEYYAVSNEFDTRRVAKNNWLMDNVMSSIPHEKFVVQDFHGARVVRDIYVTPGPNVKSKVEIAEDIYKLTVLDDPQGPEFWAWFSAYDHVCLAQLWGKMIELPHGVPMRTNDIGTLVDLAGGIRTPPQPNGHHNALDDARHNVVRYDYLMGVLRG